MAKKGRKKSEKSYSVQIEIDETLARYIDRLRETGLYGGTREQAIREFFLAGLEEKLDSMGGILGIKREPNEYSIRVNLSGFSGHAVSKLVGIKGNNREEVIRYMIDQYLSNNWQELASMGIRVQVKDGILKVRKK